MGDPREGWQVETGALRPSGEEWRPPECALPTCARQSPSSHPNPALCPSVSSPGLDCRAGQHTEPGVWGGERLKAEPALPFPGARLSSEPAPARAAPAPCTQTQYSLLLELKTTSFQSFLPD